MSLRDLLTKVAENETEPEDTEVDADLMLFYLPGCPYCRQAERLITELYAEHPEYENIGIRRVNEVLERPLAEQYDYWYAPSIFLRGEKLYEANSGDDAEAVKEKLAAVFQKALEEA